MRLRFHFLLILLALTACAQPAPAPTPIPLPTVTRPAPTPTPAPTATTAPLNVAGTYDTQVTLGENSCGEVTIESHPTTVAHTPGATSLTLTHVGNTFSGTLNPDGTFSTKPLVINAGSDTYTLTIQGQFSTTGFEADTTVEVQQSASPPTCRYIVHWVGTR